MIEECSSLGITFIELMSMNFKELQHRVNGCNKQRIGNINDLLFVEHESNILTNIAVWHGDKYPKSAPQVTFDGIVNTRIVKEDSEADELERLHNMARMLNGLA